MAKRGGLLLHLLTKSGLVRNLLPQLPDLLLLLYLSPLDCFDFFPCSAVLLRQAFDLLFYRDHLFLLIVPAVLLFRHRLLQQCNFLSNRHFLHMQPAQNIGALLPLLLSRLCLLLQLSQFGAKIRQKRF